MNRISMGVQALDDEMLDVIGRVHSVEAATKSCQQLRDARVRQHQPRFDVWLARTNDGSLARTLAKTIELAEHLDVLRFSKRTRISGRCCSRSH